MDELIAFLHARPDETGRDPAADAVLTRDVTAARAILATAEKQRPRLAHNRSPGRE